MPSDVEDRTLCPSGDQSRAVGGGGTGTGTRTILLTFRAFLLWNPATKTPQAPNAPPRGDPMKANVFSSGDSDTVFASTSNSDRSATAPWVFITTTGPP